MSLAQLSQSVASTLAGGEQVPDTKPGPYYVSAIDAGRVFLLAGPYPLHATALALVNRVRDIACDNSPKGIWMNYGTVRKEGCTELGRLHTLGLLEHPEHEDTLDTVMPVGFEGVAA